MMRMINITAFLLFCKRFLTHENGNLTLPMLAAFPVLTGISFLAIDSTKTALEYQNLKNAVDTAVLTVAKASGMNEGSTHQKLTEIIKNNLGKNAGKLSGVSLTTNYATEITVKANYKTQSLLGFTRDMSWETKAEKEIIQKRLEIILVMDTSHNSGQSRVDGILSLNHFKNLAGKIINLKRGEGIHGAPFSETSQYYELFNHIKIGLVPFATYVNTGYRAYRDTYKNDNITDQLHGFFPIYEQSSTDLDGTEWVHWSGTRNGNPHWWPEGDGSHSYWSSPFNVRRYYGCIYELEPHRDLWMIPPYTVDKNTHVWTFTSKMNQFLPQFDVCSTMHMVKLGFGYYDLIRTIGSSMHGENGKNVTVGMLWAYRMLDPLPPYHGVAAPFDDPHTRKVVVLMTTGLNRHHEFGAYGRANISLKYLHSRNSGYTGPTLSEAQLDNWLDRRLLKVCNMLKAKNVEVFIAKIRYYGVGVGDLESDIKKYLDKCASKPENVYIFQNNNTDELVERLEKYAEETKKPIEHIRLVE